MAALMSNNHMEKVRLPSISTFTSIHPHPPSSSALYPNRLPSISSLNDESSQTPNQGAPYTTTAQDPLETLRAAADIFSKESHIPPHNTQPQNANLMARDNLISQPGGQQARPLQANMSHSPSTSPPLYQQGPPPAFIHPINFPQHPTFHGVQPVQNPQHDPYAHPTHYNSYTTLPTQVTTRNAHHRIISSKNLLPERHATSKQAKLRTPLSCQRCGITETPEWRKGPNGSRTLCNACGLLHAKLLKREGPDAAAYTILNTAAKKRQVSKRVTNQSHPVQMMGYPPQNSSSPHVPVPQVVYRLPQHPQEFYPAPPQHHMPLQSAPPQNAHYFPAPGAQKTQSNMEHQYPPM